jgi:hypothetical protein
MYYIHFSAFGIILVFMVVHKIWQSLPDATLTTCCTDCGSVISHFSSGRRDNDFYAIQDHVARADPACNYHTPIGEQGCRVIRARSLETSQVVPGITGRVIDFDGVQNCRWIIPGVIERSAASGYQHTTIG